MHSIRTRLTVLFVLIVTLTLAVFAALGQSSLSAEWSAREAETRRGVLTRLAISLPTAMWNLESDVAAEILAAELLPADVAAIRVYDAAGRVFAARERLPDGSVQELGGDGVPSGGVALPLVFKRAGSNQQVGVGRALIHFSHAGAEQAMTAAWQRTLLEILGLDLVLVAALGLAMNMVFRPLARLTASLVELAAREGEPVGELPARKRKDEFADVAEAFNRIVGKFKAAIERARSAEQGARDSERMTAEAYQKLSETQESLVQSERLASLGALVAGVAHEVNTPVGVALTGASVLQEATVQIKLALAANSMKKSDLVHYLETAAESTHLIMVNAERASQLIASFKQIAADQASEARRRFAVHDYLHEIVMSLRPRIRQTRVAVEIDCPKFLSVDGYPGAFAQVISNLIINALTHAFAPERLGHVRITVEERGAGLRLCVADDGAGIAPEHLDKIFDPFFTTRRGQGGTGLGLHIVFNLVKQTLGGSIRAQSRLGEGTLFVLELPREAPHSVLADLPR